VDTNKLPVPLEGGPSDAGLCSSEPPLEVGADGLTVGDNPNASLLIVQRSLDPLSDFLTRLAVDPLATTLAADPAQVNYADPETVRLALKDAALSVTSSLAHLLPPFLFSGFGRNSSLI
jgi:hypothetical protein